MLAPSLLTVTDNSVTDNSVVEQWVAYLEVTGSIPVQLQLFINFQIRRVGYIDSYMFMLEPEPGKCLRMMALLVDDIYNMRLTDRQ